MYIKEEQHTVCIDNGSVCKCTVKVHKKKNSIHYLLTMEGR